jgi:uncharacterized protein Veg
MTSTKLRKKKYLSLFYQINDSTNLSIKTDQCMEVIKSAIREASGQRLELRRECGRQAAEKEWGKCDEYARKLYLHRCVRRNGHKTGS